MQQIAAPGAPGILPRWTSSAKTGVGTAIANQSRVWFTLSHGIFNEIYYPSIDSACVRDMGMIVTGADGYFSEEKRDATSKIHWLAEGVPGFRLINHCNDGRYQIEKQIVSDPARDTVLQHVHFTARQGKLADYKLHVLLAPHLANHGNGNTAWTGDFNGVPMLFAQRAGVALALACSAPWLKRSAGYAGFSDGWQDLRAHQQMEWEYNWADDGNVALTGEIDLVTSQGDFVLALGFGETSEIAAQNALASLSDGFDEIKRDYIAGWREWIDGHAPVEKTAGDAGNLRETSLAVLRTHESKTSPGGLIASLSIPWGFSKGDNDLGGYHLVWSRDMVQTAGGLLAAGAHEEVGRVLSYLQLTQLGDGHWPQNMWLDGSPYWNGIQMDETALPILLVDLARRESALADTDVARFWPMVRSAAAYLVKNGPVSPQDRWEEDPGYTPFTIAAEIASFLAAADLADLNHEAAIATYLREIADVWNASIDRWMYVTGTDWCEQYDVPGYYVRIAPPNWDGASRFDESIAIKNVTSDEDRRAASHLISPDALALVRFGLRSADDPRMVATAKIIDALLKTETPTGPVWHRYNDDGYGEHKDGSPFDGTGIGRGWPLLTGERGHFELAAGRIKEAKKLLKAMESFANEGGLIPEQIWDSADIADSELFFGRPSGSAMPLVWAHAEYIKLCRSLRDGALFDMAPQTVQRYLAEKTPCHHHIWRFNHKVRSMLAGKILRIETMAPAVIHWSADDWRTAGDTPARDIGLGIYTTDLDTRKFEPGVVIKFTFYWPDVNHWENADFAVLIGPAG